jgi:hypothetical protein
MSHPFIKGTLFALLLAVGVRPSAPPWQPPKSDWLYVLDLDQSTAAEKSRILVVDPQKESVVEELPGSGYQTVFARSSDGKHVYVLGGTVLSVVDSSNGQITSQANVPQRIMFHGQPDVPTMAVSGDDKTLVVENHGTFFNQSADQAFLESIVVSGATASSTDHSVEATNCGVASLTAEKGSPKVFVHCSRTNSVLTLSVGSSGVLSLASDVLLPSAEYTRAQAIAMSISATEKVKASVACVNADGNPVVVMRHGEPITSALPGSVLQLDPSLSGSAPRWIPFQACIATPSGEVYVKSKLLANRAQGEPDQIEVFDILAGKQIASIRTPAPVSNLALSATNTTLYVVSPSARAVYLVDTKTNEIRKTIGGIGKHPVLVLPAR